MLAYTVTIPWQILALAVAGIVLAGAGGVIVKLVKSRKRKREKIWAEEEARQEENAKAEDAKARKLFPPPWYEVYQVVNRLPALAARTWFIRWISFQVPSEVPKLPPEAIEALLRRMRSSSPWIVTASPDLLCEILFPYTETGIDSEIRSLPREWRDLYKDAQSYPNPRSVLGAANKGDFQKLTIRQAHILARALARRPEQVPELAEVLSLYVSKR